MGTKLKISAPTQPPFAASVMNWCSIRYELRKDRALNGNAPVRIVVRIGKNRWRKNIGISIPVGMWDEKAQTITAKSKEAKEMRFMLDTEFARVQQILIDLQIGNFPKTIESFASRYELTDSRECFLTFMENAVLNRYYKGEVSRTHYNISRVVLDRIKSISGRRSLSFGALTTDFLYTFEKSALRELQSMASKQGKLTAPCVNTVANYLKTIRIYTKIALRKGLLNRDPFNGFKIKTVVTQRAFLTEADLVKLIKLYRSNTITKKGKAGALRNFLLMCATGMRVSDLLLVSKSDIKDDMLVYMAKKTLKQNKEVRIPISGLSKEIIMSVQGERLAYKISEQKQNDYLKIIALEMGIKTKLTNHVGRHTFGSIFLKKGGKIEMLQSLMAHSSIATTMKYVHLEDEERKKQVKQAFDF